MAPQLRFPAARRGRIRCPPQARCSKGDYAIQNSIPNWAARHRIHHRYVDDVNRDPHSIKAGFWHAHMVWMLREWPTTEAVTDRRVRTELRTSYKEIDYRLKMQRRRLQVLAAELNQRVRSSLVPPTVSG